MKSRQGQGGFTLMEIMVVAAIVAILAAFVIPSYQDQVQRSRRSDATTMLTTAANLQEREFTRNASYTTNVADLGGNLSENAFYALTVTSGATAVATPGGGAATPGIASIILSCSQTNCFVMAATARDAQAQDTDCAHFTIDQLGRKRSFDASGSQNAAGNDDPCW